MAELKVVEGSKKDPILSSETTDMALFVRTSAEEMDSWDRLRIEEALIRETQLDDITAKEIAAEVEQQISSAGIKMVTAPLIRELVNTKLIERGLEEERLRHTRLGVPLYDVDNMLRLPNKENANVPHGPEATNLTLAEGIKKEYALISVFSQDVGDAHMRGDLHLHDLGFVDRPYCSGQSLEYIKKYGLNLPASLALAKPAKHPEVLLAHMVKF
ncbi:MAG: anaerobic ribonucleoside-triphosphate reductase, partial [Deltaproteobacteria bacterium]|nr:anaerobic ribonucleoside-triphosphate reductase [Deltaproteobacteria bacterium]